MPQRSERGNIQTQRQQQLAKEFLLGYRSTPHTATGVSPAELPFRRKLRTHLSLLHTDFANSIREVQEWIEQKDRTKLLEQETSYGCWIAETNSKPCG